MDILTSFVICISMYSIIPMPIIDWTDKKMRFSLAFFPVIGLIIGLILYFSYPYITVLNSNFSAILMLLVPIIISGGIHLDGLIDSCDAFFSYGDKQKKLDILKDPRTGAFGVIGAVIYFFSLFAVYSQIVENNKFIFLLPFVFVISRSTGAICMLCVKNARKNGLGATFADAANKITLAVLICVFVASIVFMAFLNLYMAVIILVVILIFLLLYIPYIIKGFGGITGDLTGFIISMLELIIPLTIAVGGKFI